MNAEPMERDFNDRSLRWLKRNMHRERFLGSMPPAAQFARGKSALRRSRPKCICDWRFGSNNIRAQIQRPVYRSRKSRCAVREVAV